jgi:uncharacterized protein
MTFLLNVVGFACLASMVARVPTDRQGLATSAAQDLWLYWTRQFFAYGRAMATYGLDILDRDECERLLRAQRVGRVAVGTDRPAVLPVVYAMLDGDVVFRTAPGEKLIAAALHRKTAFEIDAYDGEQHTGWSVNVVGPAEEILHPADLARARALNLPAWAGEVRDRFIRIHTEHVSGRRIASTPSDVNGR